MVPVDNFSVMSRCFLGQTINKQRLKCLAQGQNAVPLVNTQTLDQESRTVPLIHCTPLDTIFYPFQRQKGMSGGACYKYGSAIKPIDYRV